MNTQEIFTKVVTHLLTQGRQAMSAAGFCRYRTPNGDKCAIGCLIPDSVYTPALENYGLDEYPLVTILQEQGIACEDDETSRLLTDLRRIHDNYSPHRWPGRLREIADAYHLDMPEAS